MTGIAYVDYGGGYIYPTKTSYCSSGNPYYTRRRNIIQLAGWITLADTTIAQDAAIIKDMPAPIINVNVIYYDQNNDTAGCFYLASNTSNIVRSNYGYSTHRGHVLNFSVSYICK